MAHLVKGYDIVVVQELIAPPYEGTFPSGNPYRPNERAAAFFDEMKELGFAFWLSEEDTGRGDRNELNSTATEWWVAFYRESAVKKALDLPHGFLAEQRTAHPDFERVPFAFAFRSQCGTIDFVLISVHLRPGSGVANRERRSHELNAIGEWILVQAPVSTERDYIILGDMNIYNQAELINATPAGYLSLNLDCAATNTNVNGSRPYDHVMYSTTHTGEMDTDHGFVVVDLIEAMRPTWTSSEPYPGDPYHHNTFRQLYSDHHPVVFRMALQEEDDD